MAKQNKLENPQEGKKEVLLLHAPSDNSHIEKYYIEEPLGSGGSCRAYKAFQLENISETEDSNCVRHNFVIKEFYPAQLAEQGKIHHENGKVVFGKKDDSKAEDAAIKKAEKAAAKKDFKELEKLFKRSYPVMCNLTNALPNIHPVTNKYLLGNNTSYIVTSANDGAMLDAKESVDEITTIEDIVTIISDLTRWIGSYHNHNPEYLHLDIKPANILKKKGENSIILFDFDAVRTKEEVLDESIPGSYSKDWAAPEQLLKRRTLIGIPTDIYAIGAVFYWLLTGTQYKRYDRGINILAPWNIQEKCDKLKEADSRCTPLIEEILTKSLANIPSERYQSTEELLSALEELLYLSGQHVFLKSVYRPKETQIFVGRDEEVPKIEDFLKKGGYAVLSGVGGMGKSELAKKFAFEPGRYETVCVLQYSDSIMNTLVQSDVISGCSQWDGEDNGHYFQRMLKTIGDLACDSETLFIIDNMNDYHDRETGIVKPYAFTEGNQWTALTTGKYHVIFTTRNNKQDLKEIPSIELKPLSFDEQLQLFYKYYEKDGGNAYLNEVKEILTEIGGHTLLLILIAKTLEISKKLKASGLLEKLRENISTKTGKSVRHKKDNILTEGDIDKHLETLFDLSEIKQNEAQAYVLCNMSLTPITGIKGETFIEWTGANENALDDLVRSGWITEEENGTISLHPIISDMAAKELQPDGNKCAKYIDAVEKDLKHFIQLQYATKLGTAILIRIYDSPTSLEMYEKSTVISEKTFGKEQPSTAMRYTDVAGGYYSQGDYPRALEWYKKALRIFEKVLEKEHPHTATIYNNIALVYGSQGDYPKALELYEKALEIYEKVLGKEHPYTATTYNNIAIVYNALGEHGTAREYREKAQPKKK